MKDQIRLNLAASLRSATANLSKVAHGLADLSADDDIEQQAKTLDRIAEDANEAAVILRAVIVRCKSEPRPLPQRVPGEALDAYQASPADPGGSTP
jgi:hypothetical protein